jgi:hypothetical protein
MLARYDLQSCGVVPGHIETAVRVVDELVTVAVNTTGITEPNPRYSERYANLKLVGIRLRVFARSVVIEVWDSSELPPVLDASGVVGSLSRQWNYYLPRSGGKVVWCELDISAPPSDDTVRMSSMLPHRKRKNGPAHPTEVMNDPAMLRRVLDGLRALRTDNEQEQ